MSLNFVTNYQEILAKIQAINPVKYAKTRNFVNGDVTYLSPYISRGVISIKQVLDMVLSKGYKRDQIEKFIQELAWREYFQRVWQAKGMAIWQDMKQAQKPIEHKNISRNMLEANTGVEAIDEHILKLYNTGYMHNHIRMYVASMACNMGKAHWLVPSKWMYYHLLDGDMASNNCSWQWVAGAFSAKKYIFNQENANKYTGSKQLGTFIDESYEAIADMPTPNALKEQSVLSLETQLMNTELPKIDSSKATLVYNSYNLDPNWHLDEDLNRVLLLEPSFFKAYPVSEKVMDFIVDLSKNIGNIQIFVGEFDELETIYETKTASHFIFKEHPTALNYRGIKEERSWIFEQVSGYHNSFFSYWKKCERYLN